MDAAECGESADFVGGARFADAGRAPGESGAAVAGAGLLGYAVEEGQGIFAADEDRVGGRWRLREAIGDAAAQEFGRESDWCGSAIQFAEVAVNGRQRFDLAAGHRRGFGEGEGGFLIEGVAGEASPREEVDAGPAAADAVFGEGAEVRGGERRVALGAFAIDPGGELAGHFRDVAGQEGADRAIGVDAARGVAGELAIDVEVDVATRDVHGLGVPVQVDAESTEGVDDLAEGAECVAVVEVGPEDAGEALAGDAFARLEGEEEERGEDLVGFGLDADVVDLDAHTRRVSAGGS